MPELIPRKPVPELSLPLVGGGRWELPDPAPEAFTLALFYRGLHCPICGDQLKDFAESLGAFDRLGVRVTAVSTDDAERAAEAKRRWDLDGLRVAHGLGVEEARRWGLYISTHRGRTSMGVDEPEKFSEPGLFLIRPDNTLYAAYIQSTPFVRPKAADLVRAVERIREKDYPARGQA